MTAPAFANEPSDRSVTRLLRRLSYAALAFGFLHIVFGAIVRISGSGLGCGDHWPKCHGWWIPPLRRMDLIIEVSHRYLAAGLTTTVLLLLGAALLKRREPGVSGRGGILRPAVLAAVLVVTAALLGAVVVKLELHNKYIIVVHLAIAMSLLATVAIATVRAGGLGSLAAVSGGASAKTFRAASAAAVLAFIAVAFGGLTANVVGANGACQGFPTCTAGVLTHGTPLYVHVVHRVLAFLLLLHTLGVMIAVRKRGETTLIQRAATIVFGTVILQIVVAAALVSLHLPAPLRSLHEAVGTLVWLTAFVFAALARRASSGGEAALLPAPEPDAPRRSVTRPVPAMSSATASARSATAIAGGNATASLERMTQASTGSVTEALVAHERFAPVAASAVAASDVVTAERRVQHDDDAVEVYGFAERPLDDEGDHDDREPLEEPIEEPLELADEVSGESPVDVAHIESVVERMPEASARSQATADATARESTPHYEATTVSSAGATAVPHEVRSSDAAVTPASDEVQSTSVALAASAPAATEVAAAEPVLHEEVATLTGLSVNFADVTERETADVDDGAPVAMQREVETVVESEVESEVESDVVSPAADDAGVRIEAAEPEAAGVSILTHAVAAAPDEAAEPAAAIVASASVIEAADVADDDPRVVADETEQVVTSAPIPQSVADERTPVAVALSAVAAPSDVVVHTSAEVDANARVAQVGEMVDAEPVYAGSTAQDSRAEPMAAEAPLVDVSAVSVERADEVVGSVPNDAVVAHDVVGSPSEVAAPAAESAGIAIDSSHHESAAVTGSTPVTAFAPVTGIAPVTEVAPAALADAAHVADVDDERVRLELEYGASADVPTDVAAHEPMAVDETAVVTAAADDNSVAATRAPIDLTVGAASIDDVGVGVVAGETWSAPELATAEPASAPVAWTDAEPDDVQSVEPEPTPWAAAFEVDGQAADEAVQAASQADDDEDGALDEGILVARGGTPVRTYSALLEPPSLEEIDEAEAFADAPWLAAALELDARDLLADATDDDEADDAVVVDDAAHAAAVADALASLDVRVGDDADVGLDDVDDVEPAPVAVIRVSEHAPDAPMVEAAAVQSVAEVVARRAKRPPTLAVLIARGADF